VKGPDNPYLLLPIGTAQCLASTSGRRHLSARQTLLSRSASRCQRLRVRSSNDQDSGEKDGNKPVLSHTFIELKSLESEALQSHWWFTAAVPHVLRLHACALQFGYTRKDVILLGGGIIGFGYALYYGLQAAGVDSLVAGNFVQLFVFLGIGVGYISTYLFRVANKVCCFLVLFILGLCLFYSMPTVHKLALFP
jgi:hypothetical protein